jgi:hypothetical protein
VFASSAAAVWFTGSRLAGLVDKIAKRTGIGQGFAGLMLLGGITSLRRLPSQSAPRWAARPCWRPTVGPVSLWSIVLLASYSGGIALLAG